MTNPQALADEIRTAQKLIATNAAELGKLGFGCVAFPALKVEDYNNSHLYYDLNTAYEFRFIKRRVVEEEQTL
jgi:hypothetical protein